MDADKLIELITKIAGLASALTPEVIRLLNSERFRGQLSDEELLEVTRLKIDETIPDLIDELRESGTD